MEHGNTAIAVVSCVLGLSFFGVYYLDKIVDQNAPKGGDVRKT